MELLLIRHAVAHERDPRRWPDDDARPLTSEGAARARRAAAGARRLFKRPLRVLCSPLLRARQSADILHEAAGWPRAVLCPELAPGAGAAPLLTRLQQLQSARVAVVGHEPDLGRLLGVCLGADAPGPFRFRKAGMALVRFAGSVRAGRAELIAFVPPRLLREAR